jgi:hypothetical protein
VNELSRSRFALKDRFMFGEEQAVCARAMFNLVTHNFCSKSHRDDDLLNEKAHETFVHPRLAALDAFLDLHSKHSRGKLACAWVHAMRATIHAEMACAPEDTRGSAPRLSTPTHCAWALLRGEDVGEPEEEGCARESEEDEVQESVYTTMVYPLVHPSPLVVRIRAGTAKTFYAAKIMHGTSLAFKVNTVRGVVKHVQALNVDDHNLTMLAWGTRDRS